MSIKRVAMGGAIVKRRPDPKIREVVLKESGRTPILPGQSMRKG